MKERQTAPDCLRILAMTAVVWIHVCGMGTIADSQPGFTLLLGLKSLGNWAVPLFVMLSGRFFLDPHREISGKKLLRSITRLMLAFLLWNLVYQGFYLLTGHYDGTGLNRNGILSQALIGPYHFWYLYLQIGLYAITPFLRRISEDKRLTEYFLILWMVLSPLHRLAKCLPGLGPTLAVMLEQGKLYFVLGYPGYFLLGDYLNRYPLSRNLRPLLYLAAAVLLALGAFSPGFAGYTAPETGIVAAGVYVLGNRPENFPFSEKIREGISCFARLSFGIYLIHPLVLDGFALAGLTPARAHPVLAVPLLTLITLCLCAGAVWLLHRVPGIGARMT